MTPKLEKIGKRGKTPTNPKNRRKPKHANKTSTQTPKTIASH
jgi:hypothetical protein